MAWISHALALVEISWKFLLWAFSSFFPVLMLFWDQFVKDIRERAGFSLFRCDAYHCEREMVESGEISASAPSTTQVRRETGNAGWRTKAVCGTPVEDGRQVGRW